MTYASSMICTHPGAKMELEIRLKITQTRDDITSTADLRIAKHNRGGFIFLSKETETAFILTAHLKGYRRHNIDIAINEDGSQMVICGNIPVQEKLMRGWIMHKKEIELIEFQKAFLIPKGVLLDNIKAKFEEDKSILTIFMPKSVKGLTGQKIEEIEETREDVNQGKHQKEYASVNESKGRDQLEQAVERERTRSDLEKQLPYDREQAPQTDSSNKKLEKEKEEEKPKTMDEILDKSEEKKKLRHGEMPEFPPTSICWEPYHEVQNEEGEFQGSKSKLRQESLGGDIHGNQSIQLEGIANYPSSKTTADDNKLHLELHEGDESHDEGQQGENTENTSPQQFLQHAGDDNNNAKPSRKRWNKCKKYDPAIIAGSALIVSLLFIVTQLIRTKRK